MKIQTVTTGRCPASGTRGYANGAGRTRCDRCHQVVLVTGRTINQHDVPAYAVSDPTTYDAQAACTARRANLPEDTTARSLAVDERLRVTRAARATRLAAV